MTITNYPNLTECLSTDVEGTAPAGYPVRNDGWFLKHIDTGTVYHRISGVWTAWGLGLSFAPPTKSGSITSDSSGQATIAFETPFYDNNYTIALTCVDPGDNQPPIALVVSKLPSGFTIHTVYSRTGNTIANVTFSWLATRNFNE